MTLPASNLYFANPHPWFAALRSFSDIAMMAFVLQLEDAEDAFSKLRFATGRDVGQRDQMAVAQRLKIVFSKVRIIDATPSFLYAVDRKTLQAATVALRRQFMELSASRGLELLRAILTGVPLSQGLPIHSLRLPELRMTMHARNGFSGHLQVLLSAQSEYASNTPVLVNKTLHGLLDSLADFIIGIGLDGKIQYMNRDMLQIFGSRFCERSKDIAEILTAESSVKLTQIATMISFSNEPWYGFLEFIHPDSNLKLPVSCRISLVRDVFDQRISGYVIACRREQNESVATVNSSVEISHEDPTTRFALVGKITAEMICDARGALEVIRRNAESLKVSSDDKPQQLRPLSNDVVSRGARKILMMQRRILDIVEIIDGLASEGVQEGTTLVDLAVVLREISDLTENFAESRGVRCEFEMPQQTILVPMQRLRMSQVVVNLVVNACEAVESTPDKRVTLSIVCDDEWLYLVVSNSGPVIPPDIRLRLFEPKFSTKKRHKFGMGLFMSRQIARQHGGDLYHDEVHEPTRFVLELPLVIQTEAKGDGEWEELT
jgi:signal transduction histidine kinase